MLRIFNAKIHLKFKYKEWLKEEKEKSIEPTYFSDYIVAETWEDAVKKFKETYNMDKMKESLIKHYGGYDHEFTIHSYGIGGITMEELMQGLDHRDFIRYVSQFNSDNSGDILDKLYKK